MARSGQQSIQWLPASWTICLLTAFLSTTAFVNKYVPDSYMDEPFHIPMAQQYCRGDFVSWDPKITTFPGLYYLGVLYAWLSSLLLSWAGAPLELTCSGPFLRSLNAVLAVACVQLTYALSVELQQHGRSRPDTRHASKTAAAAAGQLHQRQGRAAGLAFVVAFLPTQLFFAFLFYTDVPALLFVLLTELLLARGATYSAAVSAAAAIAMRQTNAVWVTFLTGAAMLQMVLQQLQQQQSPAAEADSIRVTRSKQGAGARTGQQQQQRQGLLAELTSLLQCVWQIKGQLLVQFWPLLLLPVAFCAFVVWNGSITLGDKEAHAPSAHLMQPLYWGLFCLVNAAPLLLQPSITGPLVANIRARPVSWVVGIAVAVAGGCLVVAKYSLAHPYLLADNRHYTFYIWRKVVNRHPAVRYCLMPLYVLSWALLLSGLAATQHWVWVTAFVASLFVTLVPAWLLEFRYFTAPFTLAVLHLPAPPRLASLLTAAGFCLVNVVTLYVFALRPYTWVDGSMARFMW